MYIQPNSTVQLFENIPLNANYTDTFYFTSRNEQTIYFDLLPKKVFEKNSYQRSGRNYIKLEAKMSDIINCTYLRFKNTSHSNKWFYAFITNEPQYINENTVLISYEIDIMQTWLLGVDYELLQCFVEREHTATDVIGEHLQAEPVDIGEMVNLYFEDSGLFDNMATLVFVGFHD